MTQLVWSPWFSNNFLRILDGFSNAFNVYKMAGGAAGGCLTGELENIGFGGC